MRAKKNRFTIAVILSIGLLLLLQQCAWIFGEKDSGELIKPRPVGGYDVLSTRIYYPQSIREAGIEGKVVARTLISADGKVKQVMVVEPLNPELDQIVTNAIKRTLFEPATRKGKPEEVWIAIPFVFSLKEWSTQTTPFTDFSMTIYPDPAYKDFEVKMKGRLKENLKFPLRVECLLPFNATNTWVQANDGNLPATSIVRDDRGEWLIFQISSPSMAFGFTTKSMEAMLGQKFLYEFTMNQALPDWVLNVVYGEQTVNLTQKPDRMVILQDGKTQFEYNFKAQDSYESRYLEIALQK